MSETALIVLQSSHLRVVTEGEVLPALDEERRAGPRRVIHLDMRPFEPDVEGGYWDGSAGFLHDEATRIRETAGEHGISRVDYFGLAEIPHVIALGAYLGDELRVEAHDWDRDRDSWEWGASETTLELEETALPREQVAQSGDVAVRVEISYEIADEHVEAVLGDELLADIRIRVSGDVQPVPGLVRSSQDVEAIRMAFREALAALNTARPNTETIHLFAAAPVSVCLALGQELRLRSGRPVQTYRFRTGERPYYRSAILLAPGGREPGVAPLDDGEIERARRIREELWPVALDDVVQYSVTRRAEESRGAWFENLLPEQVREIQPFFGLPVLWEMVEDGDGVDHDPRPGDEYGFDKDRRKWSLSDPLLVRLDRAVDGDEDRLHELIRLFLFHEYLHDAQALTKYSADDVGSFANSLERIDYLADTYALLHQLDFVLRTDPGRLPTREDQRDFLADQIDLAIQSFWAFSDPAPQARWQERRIRRYLNWFWRKVQIRRAPNLETALHTLAHQPAIELSGLRYRTGRGRIFLQLDERRHGTDLELGLVLEDGRFQRYGSVGDLSLEALVRAFINHDHADIDRFFNSLFEMVKGTGGHLPPM